MNGVESVANALDRAGVRYAPRKRDRIDHAADGGEVDISLSRSDVAAADAALRRAGFHPFRARGHGGHRFWLGFRQGVWVKVDAKLPSNGPRGAVLWRALARRSPLSLRRLGPVVAVLGPDGAGKGRLIDELEARIPVGVTVVRLSSRTHGASQPDGGEEARPRPHREVAFLFLKALRAWRALLVGYAAAWRGHVVLCDRHPVEVLAIRPERTRAGAAVERTLFGRLTPRPDSIVVLDAPGEVLFERKGEHEPETLEEWRRAYRETFASWGAVVVSTAGSVEESAAQGSTAVWKALATRRRW